MRTALARGTSFWAGITFDGAMVDQIGKGEACPMARNVAVLGAGLMLPVTWAGEKHPLPRQLYSKHEN